MWSSNAQNQWSIALVLLISLMGCNRLGWANVEQTGIQPIQFTIEAASIASVQASNVNAVVQVQGRVSNRAPLLGKTAYELQDATGSIWVLSTAPVPNVGDTVVIKGKLLYQSILLNGREQGATYLEQQQELQRTPALKSEGGERIRDEG